MRRPSFTRVSVAVVVGRRSESHLQSCDVRVGGRRRSSTCWRCGGESGCRCWSDIHHPAGPAFQDFQPHREPERSQLFLLLAELVLTSPTVFPSPCQEKLSKGSSPVDGDGEPTTSGIRPVALQDRDDDLVLRNNESRSYL